MSTTTTRITIKTILNGWRKRKPRELSTSIVITTSMTNLTRNQELRLVVVVALTSRQNLLRPVVLRLATTPPNIKHIIQIRTIRVVARRARRRVNSPSTRTSSNVVVLSQVLILLVAIQHSPQRVIIKTLRLKRT